MKQSKVLSKLREWQNYGNYMAEIITNDKSYYVNLNRYMYVHTYFVPTLSETDLEAKGADELFKSFNFSRAGKTIEWGIYYDMLARVTEQIKNAEYKRKWEFYLDHHSSYYNAHIAASEHAESLDIFGDVLKTVISYDISKGNIPFQIAKETKFNKKNVDDRFLHLSSAYDKDTKKTVADITIPYADIIAVRLAENKYAIYDTEVTETVRRTASSIKVGDFCLSSSIFFY